VLPLCLVVILTSVVEESFILIIESPQFDVTTVSTTVSLFTVFHQQVDNHSKFFHGRAAVSKYAVM